jgi:predicted permease
MLILFITCANLANLVLSRAIGRVQELSIRTALGATRMRVVRHLISETALLAALASAGSLFLAYGGTRLIAMYIGGGEMSELSMDWRTVAAAIAVTILATGMVGLLPSWTIGNRDLAIAMRDGGQQTSSSLGRTRQRQILLAVQVGGSCLLLVVAGLMLRSLQQLLVPPGFDYENVIIAEQYALRGAAAQNFWTSFRQTVAQNPEVDSVALLGAAPFRSSRVEQLDSLPNVRFTMARVEADFFRVLRIPFLAGRPFDAADAGESPLVISNSLAVQVYGTSNAIGKRFGEMGTIVGVVNDVRLNDPASLDWPEVYRPLVNLDNVVLVARAKTKAGAAKLPLGLSQTMLDLSGVPRIRLLESDFAGIVSSGQILGTILSSLALLALTLACMGIFGVVSYNVAVRRKEIGIRLALGARNGSVILLMMEQLIWPVSLAIVAGIIGGVIVGRIFEANGGQFSPPDVPVMTAVVLIILGAVGVASVIPTLRALRNAASRVLS